MTSLLRPSITFKSKVCKQFLRNLSTSGVQNAYKVENLLVIGSGLMGAGIAQSCAQSQAKFKSIVIQDISEDVLNQAKSKIEANLTRMKQKKPELDVQEIVSKITFSTTLTPKSTENLLIIEAVPEVLSLKQKIFKQLSDTYGKDKSVVLATNTSSLSCKDIGKDVKNLDRFAGLHFFSPVPLMKLVEIVKIDNATSDETYEGLVQFVKDINKVSVKCKDVPGFIVNRLLVPYMLEAVKMLERGDATAKDIDTAMKLGAGYPMGPFELADFVGLDVTKFIVDAWVDKGYDFIKPSEMLNELIRNKHLGKKTGKGFYDYSKK
ncbi:hydroxyacyl-coenzyme A dehydrogenase-like protein [Leptotrombidium deliense]|uniref:3-hydroxyacyl-CoA dehydrogenase n=1 Tax=Leptotrombidium deliense TaxID=299467 RepID=A0A443S3I5_9ACAR|nr:hydroxyacyl-coenzyme A dehydrogenase-like protein [Leptotrombidium deliense]